MGESGIGEIAVSQMFRHDTEMCKKAIQKLRDTGLFDEEELSNPCEGGFCYEIAFGVVLPGTTLSATTVPHDVYWTSRKASYLIGYTWKHIQHLCRNDKIRCYWFGGAYEIPVDEVIRLRKQYLEKHPDEVPNGH